MAFEFEEIVLHGTLNVVLNRRHPMSERQRRKHLEDMAATETGRAVISERIGELTRTIRMLQEYVEPAEHEVEQGE